MKQHGKPIYLQGTLARPISKLSVTGNDFSEDWLQRIVDANADALPISEIEPTFGGVVSLCRELPVRSGSCDNVLINEFGYITLVECKLWRNPEAQRKVVAQVLDYAKDLSSMDYTGFESAVLRAREASNGSLVEIAREYFPDLDESDFVDGVTRNLRDSRFLLLIAGDGIKENAEALVDFLNRFSALRFTLAFVELPVYRVEDSSDLIITPRILSKTSELTRIVEPSMALESSAKATRPASSSQNEFFERLSAQVGSSVADSFRLFAEELTTELDLYLKTGRGKKLSLSIKSSDDRYNFACIWEDGKIDFYGLVQRTGELGKRDIGIAYLEGMAAIVGGRLHRHKNEWNWKVLKDDEVPNVADYLSKRSEWFSLIEHALGEIREAEDQ